MGEWNRGRSPREHRSASYSYSYLTPWVPGTPHFPRGWQDVGCQVWQGQPCHTQAFVSHQSLRLWLFERQRHWLSGPHEGFSPIMRGGLANPAWGTRLERGQMEEVVGRDHTSLADWWLSGGIFYFCDGGRHLLVHFKSKIVPTSSFQFQPFI